MYRKSYLIKLGLTFANEATCCLRWEDGKMGRCEERGERNENGDDETAEKDSKKSTYQ